MSMKESIHRLAKAAVDSGEVSSFDEAEESLKRLKLNVFVGEDITNSQSLQAALATIINSGSRSFLGGVNVIASADYPMSIPWSPSTTVAELAESYGASFVGFPSADYPSIVVGTYYGDIAGTCVMQVTFDRWTAGVIPFGDDRLEERDTYPVAGVLAGAIAVSEAVLSAWDSNAIAGRRRVVISLWKPGAHQDTNYEPEHTLSLPSKLWILGLGHLGQAVLWTLGFLPFEQPSAVQLTLQDFDSIGPANKSTGLFVTTDSFGKKKTRWIASICEQRGFKITICERPYAADWKLYENDPEILLCLPDNLPTRKALDSSPFRYIIESGLGSTFDAFTRFTLHTFPGIRTPGYYWEKPQTKDVNALLSQPAYSKLNDKGMDKCGLVEIAGIAVGAPFVGTVASCFVISEVVRLINGYHLYDLLEGDLKSMGHMNAFIKETELPLYNYGITMSNASKGV